MRVTHSSSGHYLTFGHSYEVLREHEDEYLINTGDGESRWYNKKYFQHIITL